MISFLRHIWSFVVPYRGRFVLGLLCGSFYGVVNGLLFDAVKVVIQLVFEKECNLRQQLEVAPKWIYPLAHKLPGLEPITNYGRKVCKSARALQSQNELVQRGGVYNKLYELQFAS